MEQFKGKDWGKIKLDIYKASSFKVLKVAPSKSSSAKSLNCRERTDLEATFRKRLIRVLQIRVRQAAWKETSLCRWAKVYFEEAGKFGVDKIADWILDGMPEGMAAILGRPNLSTSDIMSLPGIEGEDVKYGIVYVAFVFKMGVVEFWSILKVAYLERAAVLPKVRTNALLWIEKG